LKWEKNISSVWLFAQYRVIDSLSVQRGSSKSLCTIVVADVFIAYEGFRSSHRETSCDHEFMTNAGNRTARSMCTSGTSKSNRTDQQAKTRAIEHAPIDLTSRRPTPYTWPEARYSAILLAPFTFDYPTSSIITLVSSRRKTRARRLPRFPRIDLWRSNRAMPLANPDDPPRTFIKVSWIDRRGFLSLPPAFFFPFFLLQIYYVKMDGEVKKRGPRWWNLLMLVIHMSTRLSAVERSMVDESKCLAL